ncbi:contactin [Plakobranchus ocellatus]|uniref:Contactin n=1 Tax=Plakobranchus ocellatus TaxID=259542 RepID=A0AAV3Z1X4_9GAST|nr:contactin [Plakobranchus ocellatus]
MSRRDWYTSGIREASASSNAVYRSFSWRGTGDVIAPDSAQFWEPGQDFNRTYGVIVYTHQDGGYVWSIREPFVKLPFICEVSKAETYRVRDGYRDFDYGLAKIDLARVEKGPHFIVQPHSTLIVGNTQSAKLECVAVANPEPVYSWFKGEQLETRITPQSGRYAITNGKLVILKPTESLDNGKYQCVAENKFGVIKTNVVHLTFGPVKYQWYKRRNAQFVRPQFQKYMFISQYGRLYFSEVTRADEGKYHCIATLTGVTRYTLGTSQSQSRTSMPIQLHVHDQAPIADWGPVIQDEFIAVFPNLPLVGHDVRLECFAYGTSTSDFHYSWTREGAMLPKHSELSDHNRVLVIREARLEDQGVYTCHVQRESIADHKAVDLKLGAKPYFITPIHNQHADIGAALTWRCDARASPAPTFLWMKNGQVIRSDPKLFMRVNHNVLVISKLDPDLHNGMYQCAVSNVHGTSLSEGQLRVLEMAPNFYKYPLPPSTRVPKSGNATLACRPEGAPEPTITWFRNGVELSLLRNEADTRESDGYLTLTSIQDSDAGRYTCKVENSLGVAENSTELTVVEGTHITVAPEDQRAPVNNTVFFQCSATHAPGSDMIYQWKFNGITIDFHRHPEYQIVS